MALYFYKKYNVKTSYRPGSWFDHDITISNGSTNIYTSYSWSSSAEAYEPKGDQVAVSPNVIRCVFVSPSYVVDLISYIGPVTNGHRFNGRRQARELSDSRGTLITTITAEEGSYPTNGKHTDGYWYVRDSPVNTAPTVTPIPNQSATMGAIKTVNLANHFTDADGDSLTYTVTSANTGVATASVSGNTLTLTPQALGSTTITVTANDGKGGTASTTFTFTVINNLPTLTLNTTNNQTLYENGTFTISGTASDADIGNIVNAKYQINAGTVRALVVDISTGANIPFNKQLTFKGGILYDGATAVTGALTEGTAHTLKVWSEDDKGGKSAEQIRTFYVVPNRAPTLTVNPFNTQSGVIDADKVTFSGTSSDPDGNDVKVAYKLNSNAAVQIHSGPAAAWSFDLSLKDLKDGENTIVVEVTDTYNFKSSRTIKFNKQANLTPLSESVQRSTIVPPSGSAQSVILWVQRGVDQVVSAEISMTTGSEQEQYAPMTLSNSAPTQSGAIEDEFIYQAFADKENIIVKFTISGTGPVTLISGVLS